MGCELSTLSLCFTFQPRKIEEIKDFLLTARRKDAKCKCRGCWGHVCLGLGVLRGLLLGAHVQDRGGAQPRFCCSPWVFLPNLSCSSLETLCKHHPVSDLL